MYYQTLCKKGHAQLAENDKKWKPDLFLNFRCGHGHTFCFHVCCSHSHWASLSNLPRKRSLPHSICFLKLKSVCSCALILKPNSVRWWKRAHLCARTCLWFDWKKNLQGSQLENCRGELSLGFRKSSKLPSDATYITTSCFGGLPEKSQIGRAHV